MQTLNNYLCAMDCGQLLLEALHAYASGVFTK